MLKTPILYIIFNRPEVTKLSFEAIRKIQPEKLFVVADGPRKGNLEDNINCKLVRDIINVDWPCELKLMFREQNLGCGKGPAKAMEWFFEHVEQGIILEDDCIPEDDFFVFCEEMLEKYKTNTQVFSINGCNLGFNSQIEESYFASKFMNMWGWATWRRTAQNIDYSLKYWSDIKNNKYRLYKKLRKNIFDYDYNWINLWDKKIKETIGNENVTWWDFQWLLNQLQKEMVSIVPAKNLIKNIGFDNNATHTVSPDHLVAFLETAQMPKPFIHPKKLKTIKIYDEIFIKKNWLFCERVSFYLIIKSRLRAKIKAMIPSRK